VAGRLGRLRRADLARVCRPAPSATGTAGGRQVRRDKLNARKRDLTALSSARWAHSVIAANDAQYRSSREAQDRHIASLKAATETIEKRLAQPAADTLTRAEQAARKKQRPPKGYPTQAERFQKQRRLQSLRAELRRTTACRDAQVRHAITRLMRYTRRHHINAIAVEDLNFSDARTVGRETMGRGRRGRRFRKTVAGIPTSVFRDRLTAQTHRHGIALYAVNPAYTSAWGDQHWRKPYENVTRHEAAATVIGRRAQGHKARRREGVTRTPPADGAVRATDQAGPNEPRVSTGSRHRPGTRGTESRPPHRVRTRLPDRATVTPAPAKQRPDRLVTVWIPGGPLAFKTRDH
jgi:IS605 OrfB family transposase